MKNFSKINVLYITLKLKINFEEYDFSEILKGLNIELEHGTINTKFNITDDKIIPTLKIVLKHLNEIPDYYTRLEKMKKEYYEEQNNLINHNK